MRNVLVSAGVSAVVSAVVSASVAFFVGQGAASKETQSSKREAVDVPNVVGLTLEQARVLLEPRGLLINVVGTLEDPRFPAGTIADQRPSTLERVAKGSSVEVRLIRGGSSPPGGIGSGGGASGGWETKGLGGTGSPGGTPGSAGPGASIGMGGSVTPNRGVLFQEGSGSLSGLGMQEKAPGFASLGASSGGTVHEMTRGTGNVPQVSVPRLRGIKLPRARQALARSGLTVGVITKARDEDVEHEVVLKQSPQPGTLVPKGAAVDLVVNDTD